MPRQTLPLITTLLLLSLSSPTWSTTVEEDIEHVRHAIRPLAAPLYQALSGTVMRDKLLEIFMFIGACEDFSCLKAYQGAVHTFSDFVNQTLPPQEKREEESPMSREEMEKYIKIRTALDTTFINPLLEDQAQRLEVCLQEKETASEIVQKSLAILSLFGNTPKLIAEKQGNPEWLRHEFLYLLNSLQNVATPDPMDKWCPPHKQNPQTVKMRSFKTLGAYIKSELEGFIDTHLDTLFENTKSLMKNVSIGRQIRIGETLNELEITVAATTKNPRDKNPPDVTFHIFSTLQETLDTSWVEESWAD